MPVPPSDEPRSVDPAAAQANRQGIALHGEGRIDEAIEAFRSAAAIAPEAAELHVNLGASLMRLGRFDEARAAYTRVLEIAPGDMGAHLAMYELEQIAGNPAKAIEHQARVLLCRSLFSEIAPSEQRSILALMAPGDWQANVPIDFLIDRQTTTLHKLYVLSREQLAAAAPPAADVIFTCIAESDDNAQRLRLAEGLIERLRLPVINAPERVLGTSRTRVWETLHGLAGIVVPETVRVARADIERDGPPIEWPIVIRPVGSHAGHDLERAENESALAAYLERVNAPAFYVMPFVDFSKDDGYYRKYRIIVVDGVPYAYHLAISPRWMIHYYNAPMSEEAWMRDEERHFLESFDSVFGPPLQRTLRDIAAALQLEYFGVDCSIDRSGKLVLFEADPAMIVHAGDDPALFGYKIPAAQRIFAAFERLVDRVRSS